MTPSAQTFTLRYEGEAQEPTLAAKDGGYVLGDTMTCQAGALHIGYGAGYFAVDVHDQAAVASLGGGVGSGQIYGVPVALRGAGRADPLDDLLEQRERPRPDDAGVSRSERRARRAGRHERARRIRRLRSRVEHRADARVDVHRLRARARDQLIS